MHIFAWYLNVEEFGCLQPQKKMLKFALKLQDFKG